MPLLRRWRQAPPSAFGRMRHDLAIGMADTAINALWALSGRVRDISAPQRDAPLIPLTVADRRVVARDQDVIALTLTAADGGALPAWHPGAHLDLHLPSGRLRQYSLCGDPAVRDSYRIACRRIPDGGGGSIEMHERLREGATVRTHGPRNAFPVTLPGYGSPAHRLHFVAGGIGITPILPMLVLAQRYEVPWTLTYAGRSRASLPFLDEVESYGGRVLVHTDDVNGLPTATDLLGECPSGTTVYACGPAPMLTAVRAALAGRADVELHFERFAAPPVVDGAPFEVSVASTGATVAVAADETLLAALNRSGVHTAYSCRQGFCGTCRTRVLEGTVDHRDMLLTDPERTAGMMLTCVSRAPQGERLTLDL